MLVRGIISIDMYAVEFNNYSESNRIWIGLSDRNDYTDEWKPCSDIFKRYDSHLNTYTKEWGKMWGYLSLIQY